MFIRSINQSLATQSTTNFNNIQSSGIGKGNIFVGGAGKASVANQTDGFICAGGDTELFVANRGNNAIIKGGKAGNEIFSVGNECKIFGSEKDDQVFSIGENCDILLGSGNDRICASGVGTIVDGNDGNDLGSGTLSGLSYTQLFSLDVVSMLAKIQSKSIQYLLRNNY